MNTEIDLSAEFADEPSDGNVLPPVQEVYPEDADVADIDLDGMLAVAVDPATPPVDEELLPEDSTVAADTADAANADVDDASLHAEEDFFSGESPAEDVTSDYGENMSADDLTGHEDDTDYLNPEAGV